MNIRWKTMAALVVLNALWTGASSAQNTYSYAIDYSAAVLNLNGTPFTIGSGGSGNLLQGTTLNPGSSLVLDGGSINTHSTLATIQSAYLYYSVYRTDETGTFNRNVPLSLVSTTHSTEGTPTTTYQQWQATDKRINLLNGLTPGNYTLGIYFQANAALEQPFYDPRDGSGNPLAYTANFSLVPVPEPTEVALPLFGALCLVGAAVRRSGWWSKRAA